MTPDGNKVVGVLGMYTMLQPEEYCSFVTLPAKKIEHENGVEEFFARGGVYPMRIASCLP